MKRQAIFMAVVAMTVAAAQVRAFAQGDGDQAAQAEGKRQVDRTMRQITREQGYYVERYAPSDPRYREGRGFGERRYYRGDRLPPEYHNRNYMVDDWRRHRLSPPPKGYHWVQIGGDYALVADRTGAISRFYPDR